MSHVINEGASALMMLLPDLPDLIDPTAYTGYRDELLGSKDSVWLGTSLCISPMYDVSGPDADKFLSSICVNNFSNVTVGSIRHGIICNDKGQIMTDGVVMKIAEDHYRTFWLQPLIDYHLQRSGLNVVGKDITGQQFFFQLAGPRSLEILERATQSDLHDIKFTRHRTARLAGAEVRILRLGMAGTLAYEIHGAVEHTDAVYSAIWKIAKEYGGRKLGRAAYVMNHTEAGFPNMFIHYPMPWYEDAGLAAYLDARPGAGLFNKNPRLIGSVGDDIQIRYKTPYDVGWGKLVNFDHEFIGKAALRKLHDTHDSAVVTLEWNADDVGKIFASQFKGTSEPPCEPYIELQSDTCLDAGVHGVSYHADRVLADGKQIGMSSGRIHSVFYRRMISLGFIQKQYAVAGKELTLLWGTPGTAQKEVRVIVARCPYIDLANNRDLDVTSIPRYQASR